MLPLLNLNTSHVKVNHIKTGVNKIVDYNLNTSHVKVNLQFSCHSENR